MSSRTQLRGVQLAWLGFQIIDESLVNFMAQHSPLSYRGTVGHQYLVLVGVEFRTLLEIEHICHNR